MQLACHVLQPAGDAARDAAGRGMMTSQCGCPAPLHVHPRLPWQRAGRAGRGRSLASVQLGGEWQVIVQMQLPPSAPPPPLSSPLPCCCGRSPLPLRYPSPPSYSSRPQLSQSGPSMGAGRSRTTIPVQSCSISPGLTGS